MTDAELSSIGNVVSRLPVFQGFDKERLPKLASDCYALLADEDGLEKSLISRMTPCRNASTIRPMRWPSKWRPLICMWSRKSLNSSRCCVTAGRWMN